MHSKSIVIIPVYKSTLNESEYLSLLQCYKILGKTHQICIVSNSYVDTISLQLLAYETNSHFLRMNFDKTFFDSIAGYNQLMLSPEFYRRFSKYEYMLIYQLDAWVFSDELDYWCSLGYDYIGAPWVETDGNGKLHLGGVGNGGFSLRRVRHFMDILSHKGPVRRAKDIRIDSWLKALLYKPLFAIGYQNNLSYMRSNLTTYEDIFLSIYLDGTPLASHRPDPLTAARFAFEQHPSFLYQQTNKLPFGCHAWLKYEYEEFWKDKIDGKTTC